MDRVTVAPHDVSNPRAECDMPDADENDIVPASESPPTATIDLGPDQAGKLVIVRHGESTANANGEFSGWGNHDLTERGEGEARSAAEWLADWDIRIDEVHTSPCLRTRRTTIIIRNELPYRIRLYKSWRLLERHYGTLQGRKREDVFQEYGGQQKFEEWYNTFDSAPPQLNDEEFNDLRLDDRYKHIAEKDVPRGESLRDTMARVLPYWRDTLRDALSRGRNVLVVGHQKSLGALDQLVGMRTPSVADNDAPWNLENGVPVVYGARRSVQRGKADLQRPIWITTYHRLT